jgi:hypothetical protein
LRGGELRVQVVLVLGGIWGVRRRRRRGRGGGSRDGRRGETRWKSLRRDGRRVTGRGDGRLGGRRREVDVTWMEALG